MSPSIVRALTIKRLGLKLGRLMQQHCTDHRPGVCGDWAYPFGSMSRPKQLTLSHDARLNPLGQIDTGSEWRFSKQVILRSSYRCGRKNSHRNGLWRHRFTVSRRRRGSKPLQGYFDQANVRRAALRTIGIARQTSASEPAPDREIPIHTPVATGCAGNMLAEIAFQRWRPGHELKA